MSTLLLSLGDLLSSGSFIPHGHCYLWQSGLVGLHVLSDALIAVAYYSIPAMLLYFVRQRRDTPFSWLFVLFSLFIVSCGTTHLMSIWTLWHPTYWLSGLIKATTAGVSMLTATAMVPLIPVALSLPSPEQLKETNAALQIEIAERMRAEATVQKLNTDLERRVELRTSELRQANDQLAKEITERQQAEEALQERASELLRLNQKLRQTAELLKRRNKELDQFAYVVSHDLKAPLRAIANLSEWIAEDLGSQLSVEIQKQIGLLQSRVLRMQNLIDGLLQYSRAGRAEMPAETIDSGRLLAEVIDSLAPPPEFVISVGACMPTLLTQPLLLRQIFSNLISNSIKHHDRPNGYIQIQAKPQDEFYEFIVSDDGPGITPENHDKVFAIFKSLNKKLDTTESTGIGLSIVKKIVEAEGGQIWLESQAGEGAAFHFTWPQQACSGNDSASYS
ncbi:MAG: GHKL domain-containing protein [Leptolyngbyaceae cyanobacterium SM1_1_3]|nr:GHKL domain-containing protein [Leptolyngbyaceae cyanobacterium SM1_1_3]NJN03755.1 GHKL domain-containing protein [Leptolyngbyaceae cyanobacterium RM1_1_2]NJO08527.1 GHKL domain-containing protein [Leptolyngbyaceae cyanobacterium SL_1_1]